MPLDKGKSAFTLPKLPYAEDALAPVISAKTISFHYGKHHKAYVDKLNELVEGTPYAEMSLEDVVKKSAKDEKAKKIFNNAAPGLEPRFLLAQHDRRRRRAGRQDQEGASKTASAASTTSRRPSSQAAVDQFGSGWAWLVSQGRQARDRDDVERRHADRARRARRCWPPTCGSTPTTSTTRTAGRTTSRPGSTSSPIGRSPRRSLG